MAAEVVGAVVERALLDAVFADRAALDRPLGEHMSRPLPTVGAGEALSVAMAGLEGASAMLVLDDGKPVGIITRSDLLGFLSHG
jgi:cystathionine beta-synthase